MMPFPKPVPARAPQGGGAALPSELALWIERALGSRGPRPASRDGLDDAAAARDAVLRALAQRFYPGVPVSTQAARIQALVELYSLHRWPRDRDRARIPARYRGTLDEYLWAAFKSGAPMPLGIRDLRCILIGEQEAR